MHLDHIDALGKMIEGLDEHIDELMAPFAEQAARSQTIPGVG
jgi:hypothetical protein